MALKTWKERPDHESDHVIKNKECDDDIKKEQLPKKATTKTIYSYFYKWAVLGDFKCGVGGEWGYLRYYNKWPTQI